jgi:hypothetical protein
LTTLAQGIEGVIGHESLIQGIELIEKALQDMVELAN